MKFEQDIQNYFQSPDSQKSKSKENMMAVLSEKKSSIASDKRLTINLKTSDLP
jgi:hypothetical protein